MVFVKTVTQNILPLVRDQYRGGPSANRVGFVVGSLSPKSERSALFRVDALRTNEVAPVARKPPCSNVAMREAVEAAGYNAEHTPAVSLPKAEHMLTASWGNSAEAQAYRQLELQMILDSGGDLGPAFEMGVEDLRNSGFYVSPEAEEAARSVVELWQ